MRSSAKREEHIAEGRDNAAYRLSASRVQGLQSLEIISQGPSPEYVEQQFDMKIEPWREGSGVELAEEIAQGGERL
jgi:hypothetical protein